MARTRSEVLALHATMAGSYGSTGRLGKSSQLLMQVMQKLNLAAAEVESVYMQEHPAAYMAQAQAEAAAAGGEDATGKKPAKKK